jgi:phosphoglucosamine mutase
VAAKHRGSCGGIYSSSGIVTDFFIEDLQQRMGKLFGTDGIRGVANAYPMDVETAVTAGRAIARFTTPGDGSKKLIIIGQDTRQSGDMIAQATGAGVCSAGMDVAFLGVIPTPAVAYLTAEYGAAAGVVISASHNPFAYNGIKVFDTNGYKLFDQDESRIERLMQNGMTEASLKSGSNRIGRIRAVQKAQERYVGFLQSAVSNLSLDGMTIVLDCANGATFQTAPELFQRLGARVIPMFCSPDGININDGCGSQFPQAMAECVVENHADLGLAFDGDGDRLIAVDERGIVLTGDQIMAVCAHDLKAKGHLKNNIVVSTIMSNLGFHQAMQRMGIILYTTQVGDRYVMQEMLARDAVLGGEDSGHMIFRDKHTTGDGLMAALRLLDAVRSADRPLSELTQIMTVFPQKLINVDVQTKPDLSSIPEIGSAVQNVEKQLGEQGRVLVRYSGTQPQCRVMVEGPTKELTESCCRQIADVVQMVLG